MQMNQELLESFETALNKYWHLWNSENGELSASLLDQVQSDSNGKRLL